MIAIQMKEISPKELHRMLSNNEEVQVIDVREPHEVVICNINGTHIPMDEIISRKDEIRTDIPVVIHCRSGARAAAVIHTLEMKFGFTNLSNLTGGILQYGLDVDSSIEQY